MSRLILTAALFCTVALPLSAQSEADVDRAMAAFAGVEAQTNDFYLRASPDFAPHLTTVTDDPGFRPLVVCMLDRIETEGGADAREAYIAGMEMQADRRVTSITEMADDLPEILAGDLVLAATADCGVAEFTRERVMTPEFMEVMMREDVMDALMNGTE